MILDRVENAKTYLGISPALDAALNALVSLDLNGELPARADVTDGVRYTVSEATLRESTGNFEYHRKYIDIHVPLTGGEKMGITAVCAATMPNYNEEKDFGLFDAVGVNQVTIPAGWFCICFPNDAHEPSLGEAGQTYRKMVWKIKA